MNEYYLEDLKMNVSVPPDIPPPELVVTYNDNFSYIVVEYTAIFNLWIEESDIQSFIKNN